MQFSTLIVCQRVLLKPFGYDCVRDNHLVRSVSLYHQFKNIQQLAGISSAIPEHGIRFAKFDMFRFQYDISFHSLVQQFQQVVFRQTFQDIQLATGQKRTYDLERRIFRRGSDQRDRSLLHSAQERVLLGFAETMDFVNEKNRTGLGKETVVPRLFYHLANVLHTTCYRAQRVKRRFEPVGNDLRQSRFTDTRRSP